MKSGSSVANKIGASARGKLSREAERLLAALAEAGRSARPDPIDPDFVVVRADRGGVSVGGGRFRLEAAQELVGRGLATDTGAGGDRFTIADAGHAYLRRQADVSGAPFQAQHRDMAEVEISTEAGSERVEVNIAENPLAWLRRRHDKAGEPLIDAAGFEAGERLRRDMTRPRCCRASPPSGIGRPPPGRDRAVRPWRRTP